MSADNEITLPSGAVLVVMVAPFSDSRKLFQQVLTEFRGITFTKDVDHYDLLKNLFCTGFASPAIMSALEPCMQRCLIKANADAPGLKITEASFNAPDARGDYLTVCLEVVKANVAPFVKSLFAGLKDLGPTIEGFRL